MLLLSKYLPAANEMGRLEFECKVGGWGGGEVEKKEEECGGELKRGKKKKEKPFTLRVVVLNI